MNGEKCWGMIKGMELGRVKNFMEASGAYWLRIWPFHYCGMGWIPGLGISACHGCSKKKKYFQKNPVLQDSYTRNPDTPPIKWLQVCKLVYPTTHLLDWQKLKGLMLSSISEDMVELEISYHTPSM